jgi:hypothetical protein
MTVFDPYSPDNADAPPPYEIFGPGSPGYQAPVQGYGDRLALALQGLPPVPNETRPGDTGPSGLLSFLTGAAQGFSGNRIQQMSERQKLNAALAQKAHDENMANLAAAADVAKEKRDAASKAQADTEKFNRDNPVVDAAFKKQYPAAGSFPEGVRLTPEVFKKVQEAQLPETTADKRAAAAAARAQAAADRQAAAAERQNRLAEVNSASKLIDDYRVDPDIASYRGATQNLATARTAAKEGTGAGDLALLISYVRATEPGVLSVVRQEELQNVSDAVGKFRTLMSIPGRWISGQRLTPSGRAEMLRAAEKIAESRKPAYDVANDQFKRRGKAFGVPEDLFIREYTTPAEPTTTVRMRAPNGQVKAVPASQVQHYKDRGAFIAD